MNNDNYIKLIDLFNDYKKGSVEIRNHKLLAYYHLVYDECLTIEKDLQRKFDSLNEIDQFLIDQQIKE